jgi:hypothetical protein
MERRIDPDAAFCVSPWLCVAAADSRFFADERSHTKSPEIGCLSHVLKSRAFDKLCPPRAPGDH